MIMRARGVLTGTYRCLALTIAILAALASLGCGRGQHLSTGVTAERVLQLRPGMTYAEVVNIVGEPFEMERELPPHKEGSVTVVGRKEPTYDPNGSHVTLTYSRRVGGVWSYPMLWVHLRAGRVDEVYAKRYFMFGVDDEGIYGYSTGKRPWGDAGRLRETFGR
jgi:hypothetical protein